jgi:hypothetical protein
MTEIPTTEPEKITAADTVKWKRSFSDYPAPTWTLKYALVMTGQQYEITAGADGSDHLVSVDAATTAAWTPGLYKIQGYVTKDAERYTVVRDKYIKVLANFDAQDSGFDWREHVKKTLDALEAIIEGRATKAQTEMMVGGQKIGMILLPELVALRQKYLEWWNQLQQAEAIENDLGHSGNILVRFTDA